MKLCRGSNVLVTAHITGIDKYQRSLEQLQCNHIDASRYLAEHCLSLPMFAELSDDEVKRVIEAVNSY